MILPRLAALAGAAYLAVAAVFTVMTYAPEQPRDLVPADTAPQDVAALLKAIPGEEREAIIARERAALLAAPLDVKALKQLAVLSETAGDIAGRDRLLLLASRRDLRDLQVQVGAMEVMAARKDFDGVVYRLDALLRSETDAKTVQGLLTYAASLAGTVASQPALVSVLTTDPPWRARLINMISAKDHPPSLAYGLMVALRNAGSPVSSRQLSVFISRLIQEKSFDEAYFMWLDSLSTAELAKAGDIFDGEFDLDPQNRQFDWTIAGQKNVDIALVPRAVGSVDRVLRIDLAPANISFAHVSQYLRLAPGHYQLTGQHKAESLQNEYGLSWRIYCMSDAIQRLTESPALKGTLSWDGFATDFEVPAAGCSTQLLRLELAARASLDRQISGQAFYDNLAITARQSSGN
jgi:hypothetical protein